MAKTKKRADGLIERCRVIDGKTRHFYGRTAKEVQAKLDAALIEASTRRDRGDPFCEVAEAFWCTKEPCIKYGSRPGDPPPAGRAQAISATRWSLPRAGLRGRACARSPAPTSTAS